MVVADLYNDAYGLVMTYGAILVTCFVAFYTWDNPKELYNRDGSYYPCVIFRMHIQSWSEFGHTPLVSRILISYFMKNQELHVSNHGVKNEL